MNSNNEYYQANALVQARTKNYDIIEHRLFRMAIADLNPKLKNSKYYDEEFPTFHLSTAEIVAEFQGEDGNSNSIYDKLLVAYRNMIQSYVEVGDPKNPKLYPIFAEIDFSIKNGLTIQFNPKMKPFLLNFENGNYTRCFLEMAFELSSKYSLILLELMLQYRGTQKNKVIERKITPEELRFALDVKDNTYELMSNFTRKVIDPAIKQINERTNYYIKPDYKIERGRWRKIKAFVFTLILPNADDEGQPKIKPKKEDIPAIDTSAISDAPAPEMPSAELSPAENTEQEQKPPKKKLNDYTNEELKTLKKLLEIKLNKDTAFELVDECGIKPIEQAFKEMNQTRKKGITIENPAGFIRYKTYEYFNSETEISEEDIFARVAEIEENERQEQIRQKEESERKKAEENTKEIERKANRQPWFDWQIQALAQNYIKNGNTFIEPDKKVIEERGWTTGELLSRPEYMAYFKPNSEVSQHFRRKKKIRQVIQIEILGRIRNRRRFSLSKSYGKRGNM